MKTTQSNIKMEKMKYTFHCFKAVSQLNVYHSFLQQNENDDNDIEIMKNNEK